MDKDAASIKIECHLYQNLREEIIESIRMQHRTFISEAFFVSVVFAISLLNTNYALLLVCITPVAIAFTAVWLIEQSRMMRAGNYLQLLEDKINKKMEVPVLTWENWLRKESNGPLGTIHYVSQYLVISLFLIMGAFSMGLVWVQKILPPDPCLVLIIIYVILGLCLLYSLVTVIRHRGSREEKKNFIDWENEYYLRIPK